MPEINSPESANLQEIAELERQLAEKKAAINFEGARLENEQRIEIGSENLAERQTQTIVPVQKTTATATVKSAQVASDVKSIATLDETHKIEMLVAIALEKGIAHSIEVANGLKDPYILDSLHDKLIGELHDRLVKENKLKEI
jgi:hypothetical protein